MNFDKITSFLSPNVDGTIKKIQEILISVGVNITESSLIGDLFFGWIEGYLNSAICPVCYSYLGDARNIPDYTICMNCKNRIQTFKITPVRTYLAIANNAELFKLTPDEVKKAISSRVKGVLRGPFGGAILRAYDKLSLELYAEPLMAWLKRVRPDIFYTIVFYPKVPKYVQTLYEIDFNRITEEELHKVCSELGVSVCRADVVRDTITFALDSVIEDEKTKLAEILDKVQSGENADMDKMLISLRGIKYFYTQIEDIKEKGREILVQLVEGYDRERSVQC